jgi:uncharacterized phiE125 gp8 family phage protein
MPGLCSLNELKANLRIPTAETILDTALNLLITQATSSVERLAERTFESTGYSNEVYAGNGLTSVLLRNYPVSDSEIFQLKDYTVDQGLVVLDPNDYAVDFDKGIVRLRGGLSFAPGPDSVRVTYTAGYALTGTSDDEKVGVPDDLSSSVSDYCKNRYNHRAGAISTDDWKEAQVEAQKIWYGYARLR